MLVFDDGTKLLLSECEADHVLRLLWEMKAVPKFARVNLSYAVEQTVFAVPLSKNPWMDKAELLRKYCPTATINVHPEFVALCQLYNGDAMFTKDNQATVKKALRGLLRNVRQRESTFREFVTGRGNALRWRYSLLHELCQQIDLEDHVPQPFRSAKAVARRISSQ
uniref:Uncharacterized protein n=1 Tax=Globisporangium ultimum (strain ATCC 200006 / CBS 805.95 / DAOM BR144) TaxID=431595 RepID=K3X960_GLOUD